MIMRFSKINHLTFHWLKVNQLKQAETLASFNNKKAEFEKLRSDVQIKLKFLDENRVKVTSLYHVSSYTRESDKYKQEREYESSCRWCRSSFSFSTMRWLDTSLATRPPLTPPWSSLPLRFFIIPIHEHSPSPLGTPVQHFAIWAPHLTHANKEREGCNL